MARVGANVRVVMIIESAWLRESPYETLITQAGSMHLNFMGERFTQ